MRKGSSHKFEHTDVLKVVFLYERHVRIKDISEYFEVNLCTVHRIISRTKTKRFPDQTHKFIYINWKALSIPQLICLFEKGDSMYDEHLAPDDYFPDDLQSPREEELEEDLENAAEHAKAIIKALYSADALDIDHLEHHIEMLCESLEIKCPYEPINIQRKTQC